MLSDLIIMSNIINVTSARAWRAFLSQGSVNAIITSQAIITLLLGVAFSSLNSHSRLCKMPCYFKWYMSGSLADSEYASITYFISPRAGHLFSCFQIFTTLPISILCTFKPFGESQHPCLISGLHVSPYAVSALYLTVLAEAFAFGGTKGVLGVKLLPAFSHSTEDRLFYLLFCDWIFLKCYTMLLRK